MEFKNIEVEIKYSRGGIVVEKLENGSFKVWVELEPMGMRSWDSNGDEYPTLALAMEGVAKVIMLNVECNFYDAEM